MTNKSRSIFIWISTGKLYESKSNKQKRDTVSYLFGIYITRSIIIRRDKTQRLLIPQRIEIPDFEFRYHNCSVLDDSIKIQQIFEIGDFIFSFRQSFTKFTYSHCHYVILLHIGIPIADVNNESSNIELFPGATTQKTSPRARPSKVH